MRRDYADGSVYTGEEFWKALKADILNAKARVIIYSPFVGLWQLDQVFDRIFTSIIMRVQVCIVLQTPTRLRQHLQTEEQFKSKQNEFDQCVNWLKNKGIHVSFRKEIHEKLIVIDEHILWDGSNNILAAGISSERMNRFASRQRVIDALKDHQLLNCTDCDTLFEELGFLSIAKQLARLRKRRGISRQMLAEECGLNPKSIKRIEDGDTDPLLGTANKLLHVLDARLAVIPSWLVPQIARLLRHAEAPIPTETVSISFAPSHSTAVVREPSETHYLPISTGDSIRISFSHKS